MQEWISRQINEFIQTSFHNTLGDQIPEKAWNQVLTGFSSGTDPLYQTIKQDIGDFYWTPYQALKLAFPDADIKKEKISVISWILAQSDKTKEDQRKETKYPAKRWTMARNFGETFNERLRQHIVKLLSEKSIKAVAPHISPDFSRQESKKYGYASNWSERHTAFISGLGTFGLSDGLITPLGKAIRCGSVVAEVEIEPTLRPYDHHNAYCLFHDMGKCRKCADRCPAGAISENGHDKVRCKKYLRTVVAEYATAEYGKFPYHGCGLCQVKVPCESRIPVKKFG